MHKKYYKKKYFLFMVSFIILITGYVQRGFFVSTLTAYRQSKLLKKIIPDKLPRHVAIMMDGNGRWATQKGKPRIFGHQNSVKSLEETIATCLELKIPYLTLYAFSTENWSRPAEEVNLLMQLFTGIVHTKMPELIKNDIKLTVIGDLDRLSTDCRLAIQEAVEATQHNKGLQLVVALSYSGRWDIVQAVKKAAQAAWEHRLQPEEITPVLFQNYLSTSSLPEPDLMIRTGGDMRISNFLLWQLAYTELVILKKYWPEFRSVDFYQSLLTYQERNRRFGKVDQHL